MKFNLNIKWIEDSQDWYEAQKEIIDEELEKVGLMANIDYSDNGESVLQAIDNQGQGFKKFDIFLIDYNLSERVQGNKIITKLRSTNIDVDILFYSSDNEGEIRRLIINDLGSYEGVYIANRDNFLDKAIKIIEKNMRKMTSILNVRGQLMNHTAENDFIVNSFIKYKYLKLSMEEQKNISKFISNKISLKLPSIHNQIDKTEEILSGETININKLMKIQSFIVSQDLKYDLFSELLKYESNNPFSKEDIAHYKNYIVKQRNTLAHKKLDICNNSKYLKYCDTVKQYQERKCPSKCVEFCNIKGNDYKISIADWSKIQIEMQKYNKLFSIVLDSIIEDDSPGNEEILTAAINSK